jgi:hypothetical protein
LAAAFPVGYMKVWRVLHEQLLYPYRLEGTSRTAAVPLPFGGYFTISCCTLSVWRVLHEQLLYPYPLEGTSRTAALPPHLQLVQGLRPADCTPGENFSAFSFSHQCPSQTRHVLAELARKVLTANSSRHRKIHMVQSVLDTRTSYGPVCGLLLWVTVWQAHMLNLLHSAERMCRRREVLRCEPHPHVHTDIIYTHE